MMMSMPCGTLVDMVVGVMSIGSSESRVSYWAISVLGSCVGYCFVSCVRPMFRPEQWVYTDGSDIKGQPRLGAAVVHVPTCSTIYIDARDTDDTRAIVRAELVAIYTAIYKFVTHEWFGIFMDYLSSL